MSHESKFVYLYLYSLENKINRCVRRHATDYSEEKMLGKMYENGTHGVSSSSRTFKWSLYNVSIRSGCGARVSFSSCLHDCLHCDTVR